MLYLTFLYYKRKDYDSKAFFVWICIWLLLIGVIMFPKSIYGVMETLKIERTADFIIGAGFSLLFLIIFYLFVTVKSIQKKIEKVVRAVVIKKAK